jgi:periplasmic protein TonB
VRNDGVPWALCAALAAAAHGCAFVALSMPKADVESDAGSPIVTLELSPILAAPAPPPDEAQADAPPDAESAPPPVPAADPTPSVAQAPPTPELSPEPALRVALAEPRPEPSPLPASTPLREPVPQAASKPDPAPLAAIPTPNVVLAQPPPPPEKGAPTMVDAQPPPPRETMVEAPPPPTAPPPKNEAPTSVAILPPPTPPPLEKETPTALEAPPLAPPPPPSRVPSVEAAATVDAPSAPVLSAGREDAVFSAALQSWRRDLIAQIERHKRFPAGAAGQSGVARVAFSIDRSGRVTEVRIAASSGSAALDEAALDLIWRSQPFPAPPPALPESDLSFVAPVRYLPPAASR